MRLCAEDAVFEFPFAPEGRPGRIVGRAALRDYMRAYPGQVASPSISSLLVHSTSDPEVIVVEMALRGIHRASNTVRESLFIAVVTIKDGLITGYRDYWNPNGARPISDQAA